MSDFNDMEPLTDAQRRAIVLRVFYEACLMLRAPGYAYYWRGQDPKNSEDVKAALRRSVVFGEALHNLARFLWDDAFSFEIQRSILDAYAEEVPELRQFVDELKSIAKMKGDASEDVTSEAPPAEDGAPLVVCVDEEESLRIGPATEEDERGVSGSWGSWEIPKNVKKH